MVLDPPGWLENLTHDIVINNKSSSFLVWHDVPQFVEYARGMQNVPKGMRACRTGAYIR